MAELRPQLFNKLMAHQKGGRKLAADETSRILGILGGTALGFGTPASLDQYTRGKSPHFTTREELKQALATALAIEKELAALKGTGAPDKQIKAKEAKYNASQDAVRLAFAKEAAALQGQRGLDDDRRHEEDFDRLRSTYEELKGPGTTDISKDVRAAATRAGGKGIGLVEGLLSGDAAGEIQTMISTLGPGELHAYLSTVADAAGIKGKRKDDGTIVDGYTQLTEALKQQAGSDLGGPWGASVEILAEKEKLRDDGMAELGEVVEQGKTAYVRSRPSRGVGIPGGTGGGSGGLSAEDAEAMEAFKAGALSVEDLMNSPLVKRLTETDQPWSRRREEFRSDPEVMAYVRDFYGVPEGEEREFSDIEWRGAMRQMREDARETRRNQRADVRERRAALDDRENIERRIESERDREDPKTGGYSAAEANQVAASEQTSATGVGEQSDPAQDTYSYFEMKGDPSYRYRMDAVTGEMGASKDGGKFTTFNDAQVRALTKAIEASDANNELTVTGAPLDEELAAELNIVNTKIPKRPSKLNQLAQGAFRARHDIDKRIKAAVDRRRQKNAQDQALKEIGQRTYDDPLGEGLDDIVTMQTEDVATPMGQREAFEEALATEEATGGPQVTRQMLEAGSTLPQFQQPPDPWDPVQEKGSVAGPVTDVAGERTTPEIISGQTQGRESGQQAFKQARDQTNNLFGLFKKKEGAPAVDTTVELLKKRLGM